MPILGSFYSTGKKIKKKKDMMSKIWTNGIQLSDLVENNEQFLLFPQCFQ